jgi:hypothetical protein
MIYFLPVIFEKNAYYDSDSLLKGGVGDPNPDPPDPDSHVFGLLDPDPDPLVRGMDPDPDH